MFKPGKRLTAVLFFAAFVALSPCRASAEEGVLHMLLRSVVAIPEAVLNSLHGPVKKNTSETDTRLTIRYPYPVQANYTQSYQYAVPPDVSINSSPGYVTYNVVREQAQVAPTGEKADTHIYGPLPFNE